MMRTFCAERHVQAMSYLTFLADHYDNLPLTMVLLHPHTTQAVRRQCKSSENPEKSIELGARHAGSLDIYLCLEVINPTQIRVFAVSPVGLGYATRRRYQRPGYGISVARCFWERSCVLSASESMQVREVWSTLAAVDSTANSKTRGLYWVVCTDLQSSRYPDVIANVVDDAQRGSDTVVEIASPQNIFLRSP
jgi:hypothetical protein